MAFPSAPLSPALSPSLARRALRTGLRLVASCLLGYLALWATGTLGVLALTDVARAAMDQPRGALRATGIHHFGPVDAEGRLWRGAAPSTEGYRSLARLGFATVVDLRAEDLSAAQLDQPRRAGLRTVRLPIRDGQTPPPAQVARLLDVVRASRGPVFVHCGAGVGRTGAMAAAYLVRTGEEGAAHATLRNLAVGPPSIEQIYYALSLGRHHARQPPLPVVAVSRLVDAPRRMWSWR